MPTQKSAPKSAPKLGTKAPEKKGSKFVSLVKAALGGGKAPAKAAPAAKGGKAAPAPAKATAPAKAAAPSRAAAPAKAAAPARAAAPAKAAAPVKAAAAPAAKKGLPAPAVKGAKGAAPVPAPAAKGAKGAKGGAAPAPAAKGKRGKQEVMSAAQQAVSAAMAKVKGGGPARRERSEGSDAVCREVACEGLATSGGYCRMHYIKNWKKIKRKELILKEGKLNQYIEELVAKYPDKYIEAIRQDLASEKDFAKVIYDLDLDESVDEFEVEGENIDQIVGDIKRDFDDEGEGF